MKKLYEAKGINGKDEVIAYCRIGERSSHTWFVLKYLLGFDKVRNYDGSWTEWGNLVGAPIVNETRSAQSAKFSVEAQRLPARQIFVEVRILRQKANGLPARDQITVAPED